MISIKLCSKCSKKKPVSEFSKRKRSKDGYSIWCKECMRAYHSVWYAKNKADLDEKHREYYREHLEERRAYSKEYNARPEVKAHKLEYQRENQERVRKYHREYRKKNAEAVRERERKYYHANKNKAKVWRDRYKSSHKEQIKTSAKRYREENRNKINQAHLDRLHSDPVYKMKEQTRNMLRYVFREKGHRKNSHTADILGCDLDFFCNYMLQTWEKNYGRPWAGEPYHIDHIVPLATAKTESEITRLCHYSNLQMLTPEDNMAKSDRI